MANWHWDTVQTRMLVANTLVNLRSQKTNDPLAEQNKHELLKRNPETRHYLIYSHFSTIFEKIDQVRFKFT